MREVVDRIINNKAVLVAKGGRSRIVPKSKLKIGDVLVDERISKSETKKTKMEIKNLLAKIFNQRKTRQERVKN